MGMPKMIARPILSEHLYKPIYGEGLFIGRQTLPFSHEEAIDLLNQEGVRVKPSAQGGAQPTVDLKTRHGSGKGYITDSAFFSLFCDARFRALDVSAYEGAEIVHNMHDPIPDPLINAFDFIYNGSCMDNMFDPVTAIKNMARMLRPGGRLASIEMGTPHHNAYSIFSPAWFFDYFAINNFADCKVYMCLFEPTDYAVHHGPFDVFTWKTYEATTGQFQLQKFPPHKCALIYVIAEKGDNSTWDKIPIQAQYRSDHAPYRQAWERFAKSRRPKLNRDGCPITAGYYQTFRAHTQDDLEFVGSLE